MAEYISVYMYPGERRLGTRLGILPYSGKFWEVKFNYVGGRFHFKPAKIIACNVNV